MIDKKFTRAFTIVELLIVILIISILAFITVVSFNGLNKKASSSTLASDLAINSTILKLYYTEYQSYPTSLDTNNCPLTPVANTDRYCLKKSPGNSLSYTGSSTAFALNNTNSTTTYRVTESSRPSEITDVNYSFVSGTITPTVYKNSNSIYIYSTSSYGSTCTGAGATARVIVPTGTVRFMIQSAGGGGSLDDGDGGTESNSGSMVYFETSQLAGKTLDFHYGYKVSGGYGSGCDSNLAHPDRPLDNPLIARGTTSTMYGFGGVGATDSLIYNVTDNYLVAHCEGGRGASSYDDGSSRASMSYINNTFSTSSKYTASSNGLIGGFLSGSGGSSPWNSNQNSVRTLFASPANAVNNSAGNGQPQYGYNPGPALMIMELK